MALFANNGNKVKNVKANTNTKSKPRNKKRLSKFSSEGVEAVVEVKTVGDIPPVLAARKQLGEEDINGAAQTLFKAAKEDYVKYFSSKVTSNNGNRSFFIAELAEFKIKVPEMGYVDNTTIMDSMKELAPDGEDLSNRVSSLKKLASFYLGYYEKARFSIDYDFDGDELVSKFSEIYNYMDIMKLYFSRQMGV